jgi:Tryptophan-associated transmembrane protein (Trp_oprn_chp)
MTPRRQRLLAVLACLAGGALAFFAVTRIWAVEVVPRPAPLTPLRTERSGGSLVGWLAPLPVVAVAGAGALLATRRAGRGLIGVLLLVEGLAIAAGAGYGLTRADNPGWPLVAVLGGLLVAGAGGVAVAKGRDWPGMGARYQRRDDVRPAPFPSTSQDVWDALDRGQDPTVSAAPPPPPPPPRAPEDW